MTGTVFNIQRFSVFDGPGIRTVVFLKGCPLDCIWCHNPEGKSDKPQIMFDGNRCIGCGECSAICPEGAHFMNGDCRVFSRENCRVCGKCADACCSNALELAGCEKNVDEVMREVLRDLPFYSESGGGLTLSGGEPLFQSVFAIALLKSAKEAGVSTCVETGGYADVETIRAAAQYTDYFYYDYKATGNENHTRLCGVAQDIILENLSLLDSLGARVTLRCPIIPDCNYNDEHIDGIIRCAAEHTSVVEVHLEPYHALGASKSAKLGEVAAFEGKAPDRRELAAVCERISAACLKKCIVS